MSNKLAQFYQKFGSGDDKFTLSTGRFFSITFSFPNNSLGGDSLFGKAGKDGNAALDKADLFGLGTAGSALTTGLSLISKEIGLEKNYISRYPVQDIPFLVKGINLPNLKTSDGNSVSISSESNSFSTWNCPGMGTIEPESDSFSLDLLSTVESPIEGYFHPWMEEVMSTHSRQNVPFRRANVFIHVYNENSNSDGLFGLGALLDEANVKYTYKLSGVYPVFCDTPNLSHEVAMDNRSVGFKFNKMEVFGNPLVSGAKSLMDTKYLTPIRQIGDKVKSII